MKQIRLLAMFIVIGAVAAQAVEPLAADITSSPFENRENAANAKRPQRGTARPRGAAQPPKAVSGQVGLPKLSGESIGGKLQRSSLPQSKALQTPAVQPHSLGAVKPPRSNDFFDSGAAKEVEYEKLLDREINALYKLSEQTKKSPNRGEIWLRLAERYVEKARLVEFRAQAAYDKNIRDFLDKKTRIKPKLDASVTREYHIKAIQLYDWFTKDFPKDGKIDQALFFLGYNYFELGDTKKGEDYYNQLVSRFPDSVYVTESHFALGEFHFENEAWKLALTNYARVIQAKRARLASFAYYKAAWCLFRLNRTQDSLKYLDRVVRMSRASERGSEVAGRRAVNKIRLAVEALKDYVPFYAEVGDLSHAYQDFLRVSGDERAALQMLERLAYLTADQGNRIVASGLFRDLINMNPTSPRAAEYQYQIVLAFATSDQKEFRKQLELWLENFGPQSLWSQENSKNKKLVDDVARLQESTLRNHVLQLHQTAQNSRARYSQEIAHAAYQLYVKHFPNSEQIAETQFFHAELMFDMAQYQEAARLYLFSADRDPKGTYREKALLNAVLALEKELPSAQVIEDRRGKSLDPIPFDPPVERFEHAATKYITAYPKGEKVDDIERRLGVIYYSYNHFDQAIPVFEKTLFKNPKSENGEIAGNLILDIYKLKDDMIGLADKGQQLLANPAVANSKFGTQVRGMMEKANYAKAERLAGSGEHAKAAKAFETFSGVTKSPELQLASHYKAAQSYEKAGELSAAGRNYQFVLAAGGKDARTQTLQNDARNALAKIYQQSGQLDLAAKQYAAYAALNLKDQKAVNGFFNAAVIWDGIGDTGEASKNYDQYRRHSNKSDRNDTYFAEAQMWRRRKNDKRARQFYQTYIDNGGADPARRIESVFRIAEYNRQSGQPTKAAKGYSQVVAMYKGAPALARESTVRFVAESRFNLAQPIRNELTMIRFGATDKSQGQAAQKIQATLKQYLEQMKEVIRLDYGPMIVASLTSTGQLYDQIASKFEKVPTPAGLSGEDAKRYKELIQVEVTKFRNEAKTSYTAAVERSLEFETYGVWTKAARAGLAQYDPTKIDSGDIAAETTAGDWMGL